MPKYHPDPEELLAYATGSAETWLSTLLACHLTLCPQCRQELAFMEEVGGELLASMSSSMPSSPAMVNPAMPAVAGQTGAPDATPPVQLPAELSRVVPRPLHAFMRDSQPRFRFLAPDLRQIPLELYSGPRPVRLVKFSPGFVVPNHGHSGLEWLMILQGALRDGTTGERFSVGDVSRRDEPDAHHQVIEQGEPCIAVFANVGAPIPLTLKGRLLSRIIGL